VVEQKKFDLLIKTGKKFYCREKFGAT